MVQVDVSVLEMLVVVGVVPVITVAAVAFRKVAVAVGSLWAMMVVVPNACVVVMEAPVS